MPIFHKTIELPASAQEAYAWHARPGAFERLTPPWERIRIVEREPPEGGIDPGSRVRLSVRKGPLRLRWDAVHGEAEPGRFFTDTQVRGPFAYWRHTHRFVPRGDAASLLDDHIDWALPFAPLGRLIAGSQVRRDLERMFTLRHTRTVHDLARHSAYADRPRLTIAVSGASGLVGSRLCAFLTAGGHTVLRLVRRSSGAAGEIFWNPAEGQIDGPALEGVDAVVHLAGANLAAGRWSPARKRELWASRVDGTRTLSEALAGLGRPPRVLISASAIGFYGDAGSKPVDEAAPRGEGFLAELCESWEGAADPARQAGIRVVHPRIGLVLAGEGGVLAKLAPIFGLGLGGRLGSGRQIMSWIALEDLLSVLHGAIWENEWQGAINAVAPQAVTNAEFTRALGQVLRRPALFPVPAAAIRIALGQLGREALLAGQRVIPVRLQDVGFQWRLPELGPALAEELGRL